MKLLRCYAVAATVILSITMLTASIFAADESAKRISLGQTQSVWVYGKAAKIDAPAQVTDLKPFFDKIAEVLSNIAETVTSKAECSAGK